MPPGYHGNYLRIDVSTGRAERVPLSDIVLRQYIGGSGLGARLLLDEGGATTDPLSPEAPLIFAFSPLVGSPLTTSAKFAVVSRSPLTGALQRLARQQRLCPCRQALRLRRARHRRASVALGRCWWSTTERFGSSRLTTSLGEACHVTEEKLRARLGTDYRIASIGPAGERAVRYATISHDGRHAGRGGSGAVLGSKQHQGDRGARDEVVRVGPSARADRVEPRSVEAILRSGDRQVP